MRCTSKELTGRKDGLLDHHDQRLPGPGTEISATAGRLPGNPRPADAEMAAAGGQVLVNEASQWPDGQSPTAVLVVTRKFLAAHPAEVTSLLQAHVRAETYLAATRAPAEAAVNLKLTALQGRALPAPILAQSFAQITFTSNPLAASILAEAQHAASAGLLQPVGSLAGRYDRGALETQSSGHRDNGRSARHNGST